MEIFIVYINIYICILINSYNNLATVYIDPYPEENVN